ncbi:MAG: hypothetical protein ACPHID_02315 [Thermoplasmatota archaeon]
MQRIFLAAMLMAVTLAGCIEDDAPAEDQVTPDGAMPVVVPETNVTKLLEQATTPIVLEESLVDVPTIDQLHDPYEPTMEVCDDGSIYVTGHTFLVDTTGAPVWGSHDDGASWSQLPWFMDQELPAGVPGATPPVSDEIFLACGDDGWLYGSDITLASYPVNAWSGYGTMHEYWNFNAYDETKAATQAGECTTLGAAPAPAPVKDRPWSAYNNGTLLLTSNPAGGANQIGVVSVPFDLPSPWSFGTVVDGIDWNLCAGPGGSIPGVPDINSQGLFAAPQKSGGSLWLTLGNAIDVMDVTNVELFPSASGGEITSHYGHAVFDADDVLYVGITTNGEADAEGNRDGAMTFAVSLDDGETFETLRFETGPGALRHFYMDANRFGPGALVVWANDGETGYDWYMGHLHFNGTGVPYLDNVSLVIDEGLAPSAHVTGAAVGPDGRSYTAMYERSSTRLSVFIQRDGPTLPVYAMLDDIAVEPMA